MTSRPALLGPNSALKFDGFDQGGHLLTLEAQETTDRKIVTESPYGNWFLYWRTSSSLWKSHIQKMGNTQKVVIPLYWAFHADTRNQFDFGEQRPETNLRRLVETIEECGREASFFIPIGPCPLFPNGGVPPFLVRHHARDEKGLLWSFVDSNKNIIKLASYFDPRVFQSFARFLHSFGEYLSKQNLNVDVWGMESGKMVGQGRFESFFHDTSPCFEEAFGNFLAMKREEIPISERNHSVAYEKEMRGEFYETIHGHYITMAEKELSSYWEGTQPVYFLGSNSSNFFNRLVEANVSQEMGDILFQGVSSRYFPCSLLMSESDFGPVLSKKVEDVALGNYTDSKLRTTYFDEGGSCEFHPLRFFDIYESTEGGVRSEWEKSGLRDYLDLHYRWTAKTVQGPVTFRDDFDRETIHFIRGKNLDRSSLNTVLRLFMEGGKVILDKEGMEEACIKKLEVFFLENSMRLNKLHFITDIVSTSLGEGRLIVFEMDKISNQSLDKRTTFWNKLIQTFQIQHVDLAATDGIDYFWRSRPVLQSELKFEEIRRLNTYNDSSYKRKMKIVIPKNFVLTKMSDKNNIQVSHKGQEIEIEYFPGGTVSLDFGVFS